MRVPPQAARLNPPLVSVGRSLSLDDSSDSSQHPALSGSSTLRPSRSRAASRAAHTKWPAELPGIAIARMPPPLTLPEDESLPELC